jgi:lipoyl-dependent peroxiredoxin
MKTRRATVEWMGDLRNGGGQVTSQSGALKEKPFGFGSRFLDEPGTNPEELLAAAHASCLATHLAMLLSQNGTPPEELTITASIHLARTGESRVKLASSRLEIVCRVADLPDHRFQAIAREAATDCPMSRALDIELIVAARLA